MCLDGVSFEIKNVIEFRLEGKTIKGKMEAHLQKNSSVLLLSTYLWNADRKNEC